MRILLTANASYVPPRGGATRSNLLWLEHMAARGHKCRVLAGEGESVPAAGAGRLVEIHSVAGRGRQAPELRRQIREFQPDWVLVSSEDLGHVLLREAYHSAPGRVVYLAHTPQFFPFGPASWNPDPGATELVRRAAGVVRGSPRSRAAPAWPWACRFPWPRRLPRSRQRRRTSRLLPLYRRSYRSPSP